MARSLLPALPCPFDPLVLERVREVESARGLWVNGVRFLQLAWHAPPAPAPGTPLPASAARWVSDSLSLARSVAQHAVVTLNSEEPALLRALAAHQESANVRYVLLPSAQAPAPKPVREELLTEEETRDGSWRQARIGEFQRLDEKGETAPAASRKLGLKVFPLPPLGALFGEGAVTICALKFHELSVTPGWISVQL
jgi:hypothetical protein